MRKLPARNQVPGAIAIARPLPAQLVPQPRMLPVKTSPLGLQQRITNGLKSLELQAQRINELAGELEEAMHELKELASEVNQDIRAMKSARNPFQRSQEKALEICEYWATSVPHVGQKPNGALLLTARPVDLFKAERGAMSTALQLRQQAKNKQGDRKF